MVLVHATDGSSDETATRIPGQQCVKAAHAGVKVSNNEKCMIKRAIG